MCEGGEADRCKYQMNNDTPENARTVKYGIMKIKK